MNSKPTIRGEHDQRSLGASFRSIDIPPGASFVRKLFAFSGPGYLVAVGYMDPGNWATDLAGGSRFAYQLLSVILLSNLMAMLLQGLAARLGIVTGRDLAQACRDQYSRPVAIAHWILAEIAIAACDLAEVIGSAIALQLLFGIPLLIGVCLTAADVLLVMFLQNRGFRWIEALVVTLVATIGICFGIELWLSKPELAPMLRGLIPTASLITDHEQLYIAIGILGATVMPHNLYLHSSLVQTRKFGATTPEKREALKFATIDSTLALFLAFFINAAILILAASVFYRTGNTQVAEIQDAHRLLSPLLGAGMASAVFAVALLASGQSSTLTGTLAGQIVMEGFLNLRLRPVIRRLVTRSLAIIPAVIVTAMYGENGTAKLLVLSQVVLSLQLSFAVFPLVRFTTDRSKMQDFLPSIAIRVAAWSVAVIIAALNGWLLVQTISGWLQPSV